MIRYRSRLGTSVLSCMRGCFSNLIVNLQIVAVTVIALKTASMDVLGSIIMTDVVLQTYWTQLITDSINHDKTLAYNDTLNNISFLFRNSFHFFPGRERVVGSSLEVGKGSWVKWP